MIAYAYASGLIEFGSRVPVGALPIITGPAKHVRQIISATSRHSRDSEEMLVPGVPEAKDQIAGVDALIRYTNWVEGKLAALAKDATT